MGNKRNIIDYILYAIVFLIIIVLLIWIYTKLDNRADIIDNEVYEGSDDTHFVVKLKINGATDIESTKLMCIKENNKCTVHLPKAYRTNGTVIGYSKNKDNEKAEYLLDTDYNITENMTLYLISYETFTLSIDDSGIDYISDNNIKCNVFNEQKNCNVKLPIYNKLGYEIRGYSENSNSLTGYLVPNEIYNLNKDKVLYPIYSLSNHFNPLQINDIFLKKNMIVEVENGCPSDISDTYLKYVDEIEKKAPYLMIGNKMTFMSDETFDKVWGKEYVGMNYGPKNLRMVDVRCSNKVNNNYYATMVHEMAHTWDYYYSTIVDKGITEHMDIITLYNKYSKLSSRPFRDYSYTNIYEFFADMVRYYYFKYIVPYGDYKDLSYPDDIKNTLEKYVCIAKNNYSSIGC